MNTTQYIAAEIGLRFPRGLAFALATDALGRTRQKSRHIDFWATDAVWAPPQAELGEIDRIYERRVEARCECEICKRYKRADLRQVFPEDESELLSAREAKARRAYEQAWSDAPSGRARNRIKYREHKRRDAECECSFCARCKSGGIPT